MFSDVQKCFGKRNNCDFGLIQQTSNVQCMYLVFKIRCKMGQQWSENQKQRTKDVFRG